MGHALNVQNVIHDDAHYGVPHVLDDYQIHVLHHAQLLNAHGQHVMHTYESSIVGYARAQTPYAQYELMGHGLLHNVLVYDNFHDDHFLGYYYVPHHAHCSMLKVDGQHVMYVNG